MGEERWDSLKNKDQWLILMVREGDGNHFGFLPLSIYLMIDENRERWSLLLYKNGEEKEFLFSDAPWGDMCAPDPKDDWRRIENAIYTCIYNATSSRCFLDGYKVAGCTFSDTRIYNNIKDTDLKFMEDLFQIEHSQFAQYLKMGPNMVWKFLESVGLPAMDMLCDYMFHYPEESNNRCMLWNEYNKI